MVIGLAPGAHGSNRTGRMFTGDGSGDFLFPALYKAGYADQSKSKSINDGLKLTNLFLTAVCRCAPPENKPDKIEMDSCQQYLKAEIDLIQPKVYVVLGRIAFERMLITGSLHHNKWIFKHGAIYQLDKLHYLVCSYHPSRQNTQTGRLTKVMFDGIWSEIKGLLK